MKNKQELGELQRMKNETNFVEPTPQFIVVEQRRHTRDHQPLQRFHRSQQTANR